MDEPIQEFLIEEKAKNLADSTIEKRQTVMGWLDEYKEKPICEFDRRDIRDFLNHLKEGGACDGTVASYMAQVTKLFEFLEKDGYIDENPRENIKYSDYISRKSTETQKEMRDTKTYVALSQEEAEKLLNNAPRPKIRNTLGMKLQLETGARAGELIRVQLSDIDLQNREITYRTLKKDNEFRTLTFSRGVAVLMKQWLHEGYRDRFKTADDSEYLFVSPKSERLTRNGYNEMVKKAAEAADIQDDVRTDSNGNTSHKVHSHVLRHTYAETMVRNGCDISRLADLMGHDSIETTRKYLDHDEEALKEAQEKFSPTF